jgi:hypothetical protein
VEGVGGGGDLTKGRPRLHFWVDGASACIHETLFVMSRPTAASAATVAGQARAQRLRCCHRQQPPRADCRRRRRRRRRSRTGSLGGPRSFDCGSSLGFGRRDVEGIVKGEEEHEPAQPIRRRCLTAAAAAAGARTVAAEAHGTERTQSV